MRNVLVRIDVRCKCFSVEPFERAQESRVKTFRSKRRIERNQGHVESMVALCALLIICIIDAEIFSCLCCFRMVRQLQFEVTLGSCCRGYIAPSCYSCLLRMLLTGTRTLVHIAHRVVQFHLPSSLLSRINGRLQYRRVTDVHVTPARRRCAASSAAACVAAAKRQQRCSRLLLPTRELQPTNLHNHHHSHPSLQTHLPIKPPTFPNQQLPFQPIDFLASHHARKRGSCI